MMSVRAACIAFLALATAVAGAQPSASAERNKRDDPPVYRVELIVFAHVDGQSDRRRAERPFDFTGLLDPLLVARAHDAADDARAVLAAALPMLPDPGTPSDTTPRAVAGDETLRPIPPSFAALGRLAEPGRRVLTRLDGASGYQPVATRAWLQLAQRGRATPPLRIHDSTVVATLPPPRARPLFFPAELLVPVGIDDTGAVRYQPLLRADAPRLAVYRLDGSARLRRRQFLHLDLDLVWQLREPSIGPDSDADTIAAPERRHPQPWLTHRLTQSRVVEPGRFEYFDSSRFGVLARVTRFERVVPEAPAASESNDPDATKPPAPPATEGGS
jgi:hypothetical protein